MIEVPRLIPIMDLRQKHQKQRRPNPIQSAVKEWILSETKNESNYLDDVLREKLLGDAPKRFTVYEPLALLPSGSFSSEAWVGRLKSSNDESRQRLWFLVLQAISKTNKSSLTHLAANEGIPLSQGDLAEENRLRSPSRLRVLYGDFGPEETHTISGLSPPTQDFDRALWVSTKQNGIHQHWSPRWTMFSRGNVKEKARLLKSGRPGPSARMSSPAEQYWAIDLYAGIGYFTFSYASLKMRVLCWELNPWSVEGLRRGAIANHWSVKIISGSELEQPVEDLISGVGEQIIVFCEDNANAPERVKRLQTKRLALQVAHVNCGYLPSSELSWLPAWEMTRSVNVDARLHLHENVAEGDIPARRVEVQRKFDEHTVSMADAPQTTVEHVELVKTFAPGVWHCVFDIHVKSSCGAT